MALKSHFLVLALALPILTLLPIVRAATPQTWVCDDVTGRMDQFLNLILIDYPNGTGTVTLVEKIGARGSSRKVLFRGRVRPEGKSRFVSLGGRLALELHRNATRGANATLTLLERNGDRSRVEMYCAGGP